MTNLTPVPSTAIRRFLPELRSRWWTVLLGLSLMANLLVGGAIIGARLRGNGWEHILSDSHAQLLPRRFFADLPRERRAELLDTFQSHSEQFNQNRDAADMTALKLADVLEDPNYDPAKAKAVIDDFSSGSNSVAVRSGALIMDVLNKLAPDERKLLANDIRERANHHGKH